MPHVRCLPCKTRLYSGESQADPIGHLCPVCGSLLEPGGDLGETVGYRVIETRGSMWHSDASGAGQLIADRVGEIIAQRELTHARVRLEIERCDADSVSPQVQPLALALPAAAPPASDARPPSFRRGGLGGRQTKFASPSAASYART